MISPNKHFWPTVNKQCFFELLVGAFSSNDHNTLYCCGDIDASIVSTVLDFVCEGENVCLIETDEDLLVMVIYMWNNIVAQIKTKSSGTG